MKKELLYLLYLCLKNGIITEKELLDLQNGSIQNVKNPLIDFFKKELGETHQDINPIIDDFLTNKDEKNRYVTIENILAKRIVSQFLDDNDLFITKFCKWFTMQKSCKNKTVLKNLGKRLKYRGLV